MIDDAHKRARGNAFGANNVGAIDPDVAILQARNAARRNFDGGDAWTMQSSCGIQQS